MRLKTDTATISLFIALIAALSSTTGCIVVHNVPPNTGGNNTNTDASISQGEIHQEVPESPREVSPSGEAVSQKIVVTGRGTKVFRASHPSTTHFETTRTTIIVNGQTIVDNESNSDSDTTTRTLEASVPIASTRTVRVRSDFGGITFAPASDPSQVGIQAVISLNDSRFSEADRKKWIAGFSVKTAHHDGILDIMAVPPANFPKNTGFGASFNVSVPASVALDAKTENGAVRIEGTHTTGAVTAVSEFGEIQVTNAGSTIEARTSNGAVTISNSQTMQSVVARSEFGAVRVTGQVQRVEARTSNGAVTVEGALQAQHIVARSEFGAVRVSECGGQVEAVTSNGEVSYSGIPSSLLCRSEFGAVNATLSDKASPTNVELTTSNGAVHLTLPASTSTRITAHTSNGSISTHGLNGEPTGDNFEKSFSGTLNGGKIPMTLRSDFGSISITAR